MSWCIKPATTGIQKQVRSPVLASTELAWMVVCIGVMWCTRHTSTDRKYCVEHVVLANRETTIIATLYKAH